jgi:hypothetical protein
LLSLLLLLTLATKPNITKCANATHNIFAFRFTHPETGIVHHDCDDDGECAAGTRMAEMMRLMGVSGVAVVVTRWYGGVKLGPDRFKCISNAARQLLEQEGFVQQGAPTGRSSSTGGANGTGSGGSGGGSGSGGVKKALEAKANPEQHQR